MQRRQWFNLSLAGVALVGGLLVSAAAEARTCQQVQTDINAQIKARNFYASQLPSERNPRRRAELIRGIQNFDRNIAILRAERCTNATPQRPKPPAVNNPYGGGTVRNPPIVRTPPRGPVGCPPGRRMGYDGLTGENRCF